MKHSQLSVRSRILLAALATGPAVLTGCSNTMNPTELSPVVTPHAAAVSGRVHGGNQPVAGATVTLYRANQNGFANGAVALANTTSSSDGYGSFSFTQNSASPNNNTTNTYSCLVNGSDTNPLLYVVARGGTTTNTTGAVANPDAVFIAPLGACDAVTSSTFVEMSEVVTVATMAAVHQFMNPTGTSPSSGIETTLGADGVYVSNEALTNAFATVSNLASLSTGLGNAPFTKTGNDPNGGLGVVVTLTPELAKLNQLANAVSSCINYSGSGNPACSTFFSNATPPASASSTSVPGATYAPATDLLTALYYLFTNPTASGNTAAVSSIYGLSAGSGAPYQPTLSAAPNDWSIGIAYSSTSTCAGSAANFLQAPTGLSVDRFGDIWIANSGSTPGSLAHIAANGQPTSCTTLTPVNSPTSTSGSQSTTVDISGQIYAGALGSRDIYRFNPSATYSAPVDIPTAAPVAALASDGSGNLFYASGTGSLYEIAGAAFASSFTTANSVKINTATIGNPATLMIDQAGRIWASSDSGYLTYTQQVSGAYTTQIVYLPAYETDVTVGAANAGIASVYSVNQQNVINHLSISSANAVTLDTAFTGGGLNGANGIALDGSGNTWAANSTGNSISGFDSNGNSLASTTGLQKTTTYFNAPSSITVDTAGNLWVAGTGQTVAEVVGAAVPVYKSYAIALQTGRFQSIP